MILVVDNYDSFTHNLAAAVPGAVVKRNDAVTREEADQYDGVILSPGPGHPANAADFGICRQLIEKPLPIPMLGVCLGMQGMAHHTGGSVTAAPEIVHGQARDVTLGDHPLFEGITRPTPVGRYHSLCVDETGPDWTRLGDCEGTLMAMAHTSRPWVGVQFHPESILTPEGPKMLTNFAEMCL